MNIIFKPVTDQQANVSATEPKSSPLLTEFFEARHQLVLRREESAIKDKPVETNHRHPQPYGAAPAMAEQALYWLISAPALGYLVYLIFAL